MEIKKQLVLFSVLFFTAGAQARSRFSRDISSDETVSPPSREVVPPARSGQRELFVIAGPSQDFKIGSVIPASASMADVVPRPAQFLRSAGLEDDYGTFDSRFHLAQETVSVQILNLTTLTEAKPIYVVPLKNGDKGSQEEKSSESDISTAAPQEVGTEEPDFMDAENETEDKTTSRSRDY